MPIIEKTDLPTAVQSAELVDKMVAAANAKAARVAPCLVFTTSTEWAATTAYAVGDQVALTGGEFLQVTVAGTSGSASPTAPAEADQTVVDGTVTWKRIGPTPDMLAEAQLILIGAVKRWTEIGSGAYTQQMTTTGPYSQMQTTDTRQRTGYNLWPSEIIQLQDLCKAGGTNAAFSVDTAPSLCGEHLLWCSLNFGASYCSCGVDIAGYPIFEGAG